MFAAKFITRTIVAATAALSLAACSDNSLAPEVEQEAAPAAEQAISAEGLKPSLATEVFYGNTCGSSSNVRSINNSGTDACFIMHSSSSTQITYTPAVADIAKDGDSAHHRSWIYQYVNGSWEQTNGVRFWNSSGYGTTKHLDRRTTYRKTGASHLKVIIRACNYDSPTDTLKECVKKTWTSAW